MQAATAKQLTEQELEQISQATQRIKTDVKKVSFDPFTQMPNSIRFHESLRNGEKMLWSWCNCLQTVWGNTDSFFISIPDIMVVCDCAHSTAKRYLAKLVEVNEFECLYKGTGRGNRSQYRVCKPFIKGVRTKTENHHKSFVKGVKADRPKDDSPPLKGVKMNPYSGDPTINNINNINTRANSYSSLKSVEEKTDALVNRHIELSPAANRAVQIDPAKRFGLLKKCRNLVAEKSLEIVTDWIERYSPKSQQGDGWGLILEAERIDRENELIAEARTATEQQTAEHDKIRKEANESEKWDQARNCHEAIKIEASQDIDQQQESYVALEDIDMPDDVAEYFAERLTTLQITTVINNHKTHKSGFIKAINISREMYNQLKSKESQTSGDVQGVQKIKAGKSPTSVERNRQIALVQGGPVRSGKAITAASQKQKAAKIGPVPQRVLDKLELVNVKPMRGYHG